MRDALRVTIGGLGALIATVVTHYVSVPFGDAVSALIGFGIAYSISHRLTPDRSGRAPERFEIASRPPSWLWIARRASVAAAVLALYYGDHLLYHFGMHGLARKLLAVALATIALATGFSLTRWPRE